MEALRPANENLWYVLMTLYGEQTGAEIDWGLHRRNREAWNAWAVFQNSGPRLLAAATIGDLPSLDRWNEIGAHIRTTFEDEFSRRNPGKSALLEEPKSATQVDLTYTHFPQIFCTTKMLFSGNLALNGSTFDRRFSAESSFFAAGLSASQCRFRDHASLDHTESDAFLAFHDGEFQRGLRLAHVRTKALNLSGSAITGSLDLSNLTCNGPLDIDQLHPMSGAEWSLFGNSMSVSGNTVLTGTEINGSLQLGVAKFESPVIAPRVNVFGAVDFGGTHFEDVAMFSGSRFQKTARLHQVTFGGRAMFDGVTFGAGTEDVVTFRDSQFAEPASFTDAVFTGTFPNLSGAILHEKTSFTAKEANWPEPKQGEAKQPDPVQAKATCAVIRHNLAKQGLSDDEHFFYRKEMYFSGQNVGRWQRLPYRAFELVSDFGYSIQLPVFWLLCTWLVLGTLIHAICQWQASWTDYDYHPFQAYALSFSNLFNFLGFQKSYFPTEFMEWLPTSVRVISGAETILGIFLLFFLGLGLRTRFRLR